MTTSIEQANDLVQTLAEQARSGLAQAPDWLAELRKQAVDRFAETGFPTQRVEAWKYTNLKPVTSLDYTLADNGLSGITRSDLKAFDVLALDAHELVFVNGRFAEHLSDVSDLPAGVTVGDLGSAIDGAHEIVKQHLAQHADQERDPFVALNTAFLADGLFVHVPRGVALEKPVHVLHVSTVGDQPRMTHPRTLIVVEESAQATVVEHCVALGEGEAYLTNSVTELIAGDNATVEHYLLEDERDNAFNISTLRTVQGKDSNVASHTALFGGKLVRNNVHPSLNGDACDCLINGLYVVDQERHVDNQMRVEHNDLHGDSRQFYKGVLSDKATAVFGGRIVVAKGAQKTDAKQSNANLLLSDDARAVAQPQLEIYADDVKCTHGATTGHMNEQAVFYLMARGVPRAVAQGLMVYSFAAESLQRMKLEPVRKMLEKRLANELPFAVGEANLI